MVSGIKLSFFTCMFCECKTCTHSELWTKKLQIEPAERKEFVCYTAKGSICCVIEAHGLLPSLIKYLRVVHPKSAALLTHHSSLAADEVDEMQLHRRAIVSALHSSSENGRCRQSSSLWFTTLLSLLVFFLLPAPFLVLLCAGQGGQAATVKLWDWSVFHSASTGRKWDERLGYFFVCIEKEKQIQFSQHLPWQCIQIYSPFDYSTLLIDDA